MVKLEILQTAFFFFILFTKCISEKYYLVLGRAVVSVTRHKSCEFEPRSWRGVLDTTLCDKVSQRLVTGR